MTLGGSAARLLARAHGEYGLAVTKGRGHARGRENPYYAVTPVRLTKGGMLTRATLSYRATYPLPTFLPDLLRDHPDFDDMATLQEPWITFVVGQYGVGKTELIHQVGAEIINRGTADGCSVFILPIALADCRIAFDEWRSTKSAGGATGMLLAHVLSPDPAEADEQMAWVRAASRAGELVIALDAVDELVSDAGAYRDFLTALASFVESLMGGAVDARLRIVVTSRIETLQSCGDADGQLAARFMKVNPVDVEVYFMRLDLMGESEAADFLSLRLARKPTAFFECTQVIEEEKEVLRMLQRPLLARIFCDLVLESDDSSALLQRLRLAPGPATLVKIFVATALGDEILLSEQAEIQKATWDKDALADCTALLYLNSRQHFNMADIKSFMRLRAPLGEGEDEDSHYLSGLHKCPFLIVDPRRKRADFSHRIFLEYFTAQGLWRSQAKCRDGGKHEYPLFDELVLNVDMRKLLRGIVVDDSDNRPEAWYEATRRSYGLNEPESWEARDQPEGPLPLAELDSVRCAILEIMTEANDDMRGHHTAIRRFFDLMRDWFHPRYAVFNYEGIAVYINLFKYAEKEARRIDTEFSGHLKAKLADAFDRLLAAHDGDIDRPYELLAERIVSIALRLGYDWIWEEFAVVTEGNFIRSPDVRNRVKRTLERFERAPTAS